jgi:plasmid maintenance system antidote protein VapI
VKAMTNTQELEHKILSANVSKRELAKRLEISETSLYQKLNNKREFKASEISKLQVALGLSVAETVHIFLQ